MAKTEVCYKKTCWSTKNTIIEKAEKSEEEHFKEELDRRVEPHSHKKSNDGDRKDGDRKDNTTYGLSRTYLKNAEALDKKNSSHNPSFSYTQNILEDYNEEIPGIIQKNSKKVDGVVKLTLNKIIKVGEYIMALTNPQWNKVMGSFEDKDTYAPSISQKESVSEENAKYEIGYNFLKYRN